MDLNNLNLEFKQQFKLQIQITKPINQIISQATRLPTKRNSNPKQYKKNFKLIIN